MSKRTARSWRLYDLVFLATAIALWLFPFFKAGWKGGAYPKLPGAVRFQYNAAGLFTRRSTRWWDHHIELQQGDDSRIELDERRVFPMGAFGFRTRYDRILNETNRGSLSAEVRQRLADHIAQDLQESGSESDRAVKAIRLIRSVWQVGAPELAEAPGQWNPPPVQEIMGPNRFRLGTYVVEDGRTTEVTFGGKEVEPGAPQSPRKGGQVQRRVTVRKSDRDSAERLMEPDQGPEQKSPKETAGESASQQPQ